MALKEYRCHRWPSLSIGSGTDIKFVDGVYRTDNEAEQALIEGLDYYGPLVWHEPTTGALEAVSEPEVPEEAPRDVIEHKEPPASLGTPDRPKWRVKI